MLVTTKPLYRFLSRPEYCKQEPAAIPASIGAIKESLTEYDDQSDTFVTTNVCASVLGGLSLRQHLPGHPKLTIRIEKVPSPETWSDAVYYLPAEFVPGSLLETVARKGYRLMVSDYYRVLGGPTPSWHRAADAVSELGFFPCYELPAGTPLPDGFACVVDDFPVAGHATIHTTRSQSGKLVSILPYDYIYSEALHGLPWEFSGYFLCPAAETRGLAHCEDEQRHGAQETGRILLNILCRYQDVYSLEQLESLHVLVAAPDYALPALAALLPPAAALDLLDAAMDASSAIEELNRVGDLAQLVRALEQASGSGVLM